MRCDEDNIRPNNVVMSPSSLQRIRSLELNMDANMSGTQVVHREGKRIFAAVTGIRYIGISH